MELIILLSSTKTELIAEGSVRLRLKSLDHIIRMEQIEVVTKE